MNNIDTEDPPSALEWHERLQRITGTFHLLLSEGVFFGLVTPSNYHNEKATKFNQDLYYEMRRLYKDNLPFMSR